MLFKNCRKICLEIAEKLDDKEDEASSPELNFAVIVVSFRFSAIFAYNENWSTRKIDLCDRHCFRKGTC